MINLYYSALQHAYPFLHLSPEADGRQPDLVVMLNKEKNNFSAQVLVVIGQVLRLQNRLAKSLEQHIPTRSRCRVKLEFFFCLDSSDEFEQELELSTICRRYEEPDQLERVHSRPYALL